MAKGLGRPARFGGTDSKFGTSQKPNETEDSKKKKKQKLAVIIKKREEDKRKGKTA
jgi:hypothetical protein